MTHQYQPREVDLFWEFELRHLDEAEFAFDVWEDALDAPNYTLDELARGPEQRLLAHVDALTVGGPIVADRLLWPTIRDSNKYGERIAAAVLACEDASVALAALRDANDDEHRRGLVRGLELRNDAGLDEQIVRGLETTDAETTAALLEILARRGVRAGDWLVPLLGQDDVHVQRAAAWLARHVDGHEALEALGPLAQSEDAMVRQRAIETGLLRRVSGAWGSAVYWALTDRGSPMTRQALVWIAQLGDSAAHERLLELLDEPEHQADVLWALSFSGSVAAVQRCLALLEHDELGPLAAEVVCSIAGLPVDEDSFWRPSPRGDDPHASLPQLSADDLDEDLSLTPEDLLPTPKPTAIAAWWREREREFDPRVRYLAGRPFEPATLVNALHDAPLRRRHNLAFELGVRSTGDFLLATRAFSHVQTDQLATLGQHPTLHSIDFQRTFAR